MNTNLTNPYHHFLRMVWKMRKAQKEAKRNPHARSAQTTAESLEREVDKWMEQVGFETAKVKQMGLPIEEPKNEP